MVVDHKYEQGCLRKGNKLYKAVVWYWFKLLDYNPYNTIRLELLGEGGMTRPCIHFGAKAEHNTAT